MSSTNERGAGAEHALTDADRRRSLIAVIACVSVAALTQGLTWPLLGLILERHGASAAVNGLNATAQSVAVFFVSPLAATIGARLGMARATAVALGLAAGAVLALPLVEPGLAWVPLRFVLGAGTVTLYILSETWINQVCPEAERGRILGIYGTLWAAGFGAGPLIIALVGSESWPPFVVGAALLLLAIPPLALARGTEPRLARERGASSVAVVARAPVAILAMLMFGVVDAAAVSLLVVWGVRVGLDGGTAVGLLSVLLIGAVASQMPAGWLADRMSRGRLMVACVAVMAVAILLVPLAAQGTWALWPLVALWGAAMGATYIISVVLVGERFRGRDLAAANSVRAIAWSAGSVTGPPLAGAAMDAHGPDGMMVVIGGACLAFLAFALLRGAHRSAGTRT